MSGITCVSDGVIDLTDGHDGWADAAAAVVIVPAAAVAVVIAVSNGLNTDAAANIFAAVSIVNVDVTIAVIIIVLVLVDNDDVTPAINDIVTVHCFYLLVICCIFCRTESNHVVFRLLFQLYHTDHQILANSPLAIVL